jgi:hypothetical protein
MRLELHLSEQLQNLFPVSTQRLTDPALASSDRIEHFPLPLSSPSSGSKDVSPSKASSSSALSAAASMTSKTEDSLTYSLYNPSDTVRTISAGPSSPLSSSLHSQPQPQPHSPYLETLNGEMIVTSTEGKREREATEEEEEEEEEEDYREEDYENETPVETPSPPSPSPPSPSPPPPSITQEQKVQNLPEQVEKADHAEQRESGEEQSYLADDFEADEYGEEEFETPE